MRFDVVATVVALSTKSGRSSRESCDIGPTTRGGYDALCRTSWDVIVDLISCVQDNDLIHMSFNDQLTLSAVYSDCKQSYKLTRREVCVRVCV